MVETLLPIAILPVLLLAVGAALPIRWKWTKVVLVVLAALTAQGFVAMGLGVAREEGAEARATRDALWGYLESVRPLLLDSARTGRPVGDSALPQPPRDSWDNEVRLESHRGLRVVWSYGSDGRRQFDEPPGGCRDRARPHQDILLGMDGKGGILRLQVPGISGDPSCSRAPDAPPAKHVYPVLAGMVLVTFVSLARLVSQLKQARSAEAKSAAAKPASPPLAGALRETMDRQEVFRFENLWASYSAILAGPLLAGALVQWIARKLPELPTLAPGLVLVTSGVLLAALVAIVRTEVRCESGGELRLVGMVGGETVRPGREPTAWGGIAGLYFVGRRSLVVLPLFDDVEALRGLLEELKFGLENDAG